MKYELRGVWKLFCFVFEAQTRWEIDGLSVIRVKQINSSQNALGIAYLLVYEHC